MPVFHVVGPKKRKAPGRWSGSTRQHLRRWWSGPQVRWTTVWVSGSPPGPTGGGRRPNGRRRGPLLSLTHGGMGDAPSRFAAGSGQRLSGEGGEGRHGLPRTCGRVRPRGRRHLRRAEGPAAGGQTAAAPPGMPVRSAPDSDPERQTRAAASASASCAYWVVFFRKTKPVLELSGEAPPSSNRWLVPMSTGCQPEEKVVVLVVG